MASETYFTRAAGGFVHVRKTEAFTSGRRAQNASSEWNGQKRNIVVNL